MTPLAFYKQLIEGGVPHDVAMPIAEKFEADQLAESLAKLEARREKDAQRKRDQRVRDGHAESRGQGVTGRDSAGPSPHVGAGAQVVNPSLPSLRSEEVVVGGVVAPERDPDHDDWPEGRASDHADQLIALVASPWLDPNKSPDLVTTRGRVAAWKRDGASWEHDVVPVVTGLCANRRSRISSWKFFDAAISRSIAENRAALEIPAAGEVIPLRPGGGASITDRIAAEEAEARRRAFAMLEQKNG